jgi:hypothetical protein
MWSSSDRKLTIRAFGEEDLEFLDRLCSDPEALGPFEFAGIGDPRARRRRWERDGFISQESTAVAVAGLGRLRAAARRAQPRVNWKFARWTLPSSSLTMSWRQVFAQERSVFQT